MRQGLFEKCDKIPFDMPVNCALLGADENEKLYLPGKLCFYE